MGYSGLVPTELKSRALYDQAVLIETSNFDILAAKAVGEKVFKPMLWMKADEKLVAELIQGPNGKLDCYESIWYKQK